MLDLTTRTNSKKLYQIKMPDGKVLNLKMPTQSLLMKVQDLQIYLDNPMQALQAMNNIVCQILNLNTEGITYKEEQIMEMIDMDTLVLIIQDYLAETTKTLGE